MLKFAAISPHPLAIIPFIGFGSEFDSKKISKTIKAMEDLAKILKSKKIDTLVIVSPHGPANYQEMTINASAALSGNFQQFKDYQTSLSFKNDLAFADALFQKCREQKIPVRLTENPALDHGILIPLYYLLKNYENGKTPNIVPISSSFLGARTHFELGKIIFEVAKNSNKKIGVVASGDLSHRLTSDAPSGFSPQGAEFNEKIIEFLQEKNIKGFLNIDPELVKEAGECGYLPIAVLLGVLSGVKKINFNLLSYEGPFGVGYLTGYFSLEPLLTRLFKSLG